MCMHNGKIARKSVYQKKKKEKKREREETTQNANSKIILTVSVVHYLVPGNVKDDVE